VSAQRWLRVATATCLASLLGCQGWSLWPPKWSPTGVTVDTSPDIPKYRIEKVVVVPFEAAAVPQLLPSSPQFFVPPGAKRSDITPGVPPSPEQLNPVTTTVPGEAAEKVTRIFYEKLHARLIGIHVLSPDEARRVMSVVSKEQPDQHPQEMARSVAIKLSANAAVYGQVLVYRDREGSKWGGEPATVGIQVKLLAADGNTLWVANYYEKQQPMNQDLVGFIQHGGVFVTAEELAEYGVDRLIKKFPFPRK
jgi:hypothetical protein